MKHLLTPFLFIAVLFTSCDSGPRGIVFKKADYGDKWPFTVEQIDVYCAGLGKNEVYFETGDKTYALNGEAQSAVENGRSAHATETYNEVLLDDTEYPGYKMIVPGEFIRKAFEYCED